MSPTALAVLHGVGELESGHRYDAIGSVTRSGDRAYGKYQVMGHNVPTWTSEHLGVRMTVQQFLEDPMAQERLAGIIFTKRIGEHGIEDAISMWFSGRKARGNVSCDVNGTCVPEYIETVLSYAR